MPQLASLAGVPTPLRSGPLVTDPDRSETSGWTPLSMTATRTPLPWVTGQAVGASTASSTHCWALRTLSARAGWPVARTGPAPAAVSTSRPPTARRAGLPVSILVTLGSAAPAARRRVASRTALASPLARLNISASVYPSVEIRTRGRPSAKPAADSTR